MKLRNFLKVYQQGDATLVSAQEQSLQQSSLCSWVATTNPIKVNGLEKLKTVQRQVSRNDI